MAELEKPVAGTAGTEAEKPAVETKPPTEAELEFQREKMKSVFFGYPDPGGDQPPPEEKTDDGTEKPLKTSAEVAEEKAKEKEKPSPAERLAIQRKSAELARAAKKRKGAPAPPPPAPTDEDRTEMIAAATAAGVERVLSKVAPQVGQSIGERIALGSDEQELLRVMEEMGTRDAKYKDLAAQTKEFWNKEESYVSEWKKNHPGEVYNPEDEEHTDFYQHNEPQYSSTDYRRAEVRLEAKPIAEEMVKERMGASDKKLSQMETRQRMRDEQPELEELAYTGQKDMVKAIVGFFEDAEDESLKTIGTELAGILGVKGDKFEIDQALVDKLSETDPVACRVMTEAADKLRACIVEAERLLRYPDVYQFQPDKPVKLLNNGQDFYAHREVDAFASRLEADLAAMPAEETAMDGKTFVTGVKWRTKLNEIDKANLTVERKRAAWEQFTQRHYKLEGPMILRGLAGEFAGEAAKRIAEINELTNVRLKKGAPVGSQTTTTAAPGGPGVVRERPKPPAAITPSAAADKGGSSPQTDAERLALVQQRY